MPLKDETDDDCSKVAKNNRNGRGQGVT